MKENSKVSLILYQDQDRPKYYEIHKSMVKFLLYALPLLTVGAMALLVIGALSIKQIRVAAARKEPRIIQELRVENESLELRFREVHAFNQELETRLSTTSVDSDALSGTLGLFKIVPGMQDLSANPSIGIEEVQLSNDTGETKLSFNLTNLAAETNRQVGYIFALLISGSHISIYPENAFSEDDPLIAFSKGENFAMARLRPVEAIFKTPANTKRGIVKILLFSRTGDLIAKNTQSFNL